MTESTIQKYGVEIKKDRPKVQVNVNYNLESTEGRQLVKKVTKTTIQTHADTLRKLADM